MITNFKIFENNNNNNNNSIIDYTYLKKNTIIDDIKKICEDVEKNNVYGLVVYPEHIGTVKAFLEDNNIKIISVIDYPKGTSKSNFKIKETMNAITDGADEIEVVFNYKKLKNLFILKEEDYQREYEEILNEIQTITRLSHKNGVLVKVIIEIEELTFDDIKTACEICEVAGADFVQTSTGFSKKTPNWNEKIEKVKYMRRILPNYIEIKASGGIRNQTQIDELKSIGVNRIGTSVFI